MNMMCYGKYLFSVWNMPDVHQLDMPRKIWCIVHLFTWTNNKGSSWPSVGWVVFFCFALFLSLKGWGNQSGSEVRTGNRELPGLSNLKVFLSGLHLRCYALLLSKPTPKLHLFMRFIRLAYPYPTKCHGGYSGLPIFVLIFLPSCSTS